MMNREQTQKLLASFFEAKPPFTEVSEFTGHSGSATPEVLRNWMEEADPDDRQAVVDLLCSELVDSGSQNFPVPQSAVLLVEAVSNFPQSLSQEATAKLEAYARRGDNLSRWLEDEDSEDQSDADYRDRWRFALALWNVLYIKQLPVATELFQLFTSRAKDDNFKRSINIAKRVRDNPRLI